MRHWTKKLFALAAPLLLTGCLWGPGKFASDLTIRKDGSFTLDYRGEVVLQVPPDDYKPTPWKDSMAQCHGGGRVDWVPDIGIPVNSSPDDPITPCTNAQIAQAKSKHEHSEAAALADNRKKSEDIAKAFGLPGLDDESNRAFAAKLMKYAGWRSVAYRGHGVFDVDYHMEGSTKQDFLFPAFPDNNLIVPFVALRRRADGSVLVTAPAFTGGAGALGNGMPMTGPTKIAEGGPVSRAK